MLTTHHKSKRKSVKDILPSYLGDNCDRFELQGMREGHIVKIDLSIDSDMSAPWDAHDGTGIVKRLDDRGWWSNEQVTYRPKRAGQRILSRGDCRSFGYMYDWQATMKKAREEEWGCADETHAHKTKGEMRECSVQFDFEYLRGYANGDWNWLNLGVIIEDDDGNVIQANGEDLSDYIGGFDGCETSRSYINDNARHMLANLLVKYRKAFPVNEPEPEPDLDLNPEERSESSDDSHSIVTLANSLLFLLDGDVWTDAPEMAGTIDEAKELAQKLRDHIVMEQRTPKQRDDGAWYWTGATGFDYVWRGPGKTLWRGKEQYGPSTWSDPMFYNLHDATEYAYAWDNAFHG